MSVLIYALTCSETLVLMEDFMTDMCVCYCVDLYVDVWTCVLINVLTGSETLLLMEGFMTLTCAGVLLCCVGCWCMFLFVAFCVDRQLSTDVDWNDHDVCVTLWVCVLCVEVWIVCWHVVGWCVDVCNDVLTCVLTGSEALVLMEDSMLAGFVPLLSAPVDTVYINTGDDKVLS